MQGKNEKRPVIGYMCSYVPYNYLSRLGFTMLPFNSLKNKDLYRINKLSPNLCSYSMHCASLIDNAEYDGLILTNCCNSMQRIYDYARLTKPEIFTYMLELPRGYDEKECRLFGESVSEMIGSLCDFFGMDKPEPEVPESALGCNESALGCKDSAIDSKDTEDMAGGSVDGPGESKGEIYVYGSQISQGIQDALRECFEGYTLTMNHCGVRENGDLLYRKYLAMKAAEGGEGEGEGRSVKYCTETPCARMDYFIDWFIELLEKNGGISGVICISSQNCDNLLFNFPIIERICKDRGIPVIKLEESYGSRSLGQFMTRLEAFLECIEYGSKERRKERAVDAAQGAIAGAEGDVEAKFAEVAAADAAQGTATEDVRGNMAGTVEGTAAKVEGNTPGEIPRRNVFVQRVKLTKAVLSELPLKAIQQVVEDQIDIYTKRVWQEPENMVWTNMGITTEPFYSAGLVPLNTELIAGWLATLQLSRKYIAQCESMGLHPSVCSFHKATLGLIESGGIIKPRGAAFSSHICDGGVGLANIFRWRYGTDTFVLNIPFKDTPETRKYLVEQYKDLIAWIERYTGRPLPLERISETLDLSNRTREYWKKVLELRRGMPVISGYPLLRNIFGASFLFGSEVGYNIIKTYYEEMKAIYEGVPDEKDPRNDLKRILWIHFAPFYNNSILEYLEEELRCYIVLDMTAYVYQPDYDIDKPLESLAERAITHAYLGDPEDRKRLYRRAIEEYEVDGVVHMMQTGCRTIAGASWQVREVAEEMGIPYLELNADCADPRGISEEQIKLRMEAFKERLWRR